MYLTVRLLASAIALLATASIPARPDDAIAGYQAESGGRLFAALIQPWGRYDARWYLHVAQSGYSPSNTSATMFPVFPLAIRAIHAVTPLGWLSSALFITNVCFLLSLYFLYRIVAADRDDETATATLWYQALFPGSLFFLAPYSESVLLCLSTGAWLAARQRRWATACLAAAACGATRNVGLVIAFPLALEFLRQRRAEPRVEWWRAAWFAVIPIGLGAYLFYWYSVTRSPFYFLRQSAAWGRHWSWPWTTLAIGIEQGWRYATVYPGGVYVLEAAAAIFFVVLAVLAIRRLSPSLQAYVWGGMLPVFCNPYPGRVLCSMLRYGAILFPAFMVLAQLAHKRERSTAVLISFAALYALATALFVTSQWMF